MQSLLAENGAKVDAANSIVKIPSSLVQEATRKAPKEMALCGRNTKFDLKLPSKGLPFVAPNGCTNFMNNLETGEKRMTKASDLEDFAILCARASKSRRRLVRHFILSLSILSKPEEPRTNPR